MLHGPAPPSGPLDLGFGSRRTTEGDARTFGPSSLLLNMVTIVRPPRGWSPTSNQRNDCLGRTPLLHLRRAHGHRPRGSVPVRPPTGRGLVVVVRFGMRHGHCVEIGSRRRGTATDPVRRPG